MYGIRCIQLDSLSNYFVAKPPLPRCWLQFYYSIVPQNRTFSLNLFLSRNAQLKHICCPIYPRTGVSTSKAIIKFSELLISVAMVVWNPNKKHSFKSGKNFQTKHKHILKRNSSIGPDCQQTLMGQQQGSQTLLFITEWHPYSIL